ncbi:MAG: FMN-binding protein [Candidatus Neomarinimicrobiota bacterium]
MQKKYLRLLFLALIFPGPAESGNIKNRAEELIQAQFGKEINIQFNKFKLNPDLKTAIAVESKQKFLNDFLYVWKISIGDSLAGYALLDNVLGKSMPITFIVFFDLEGIILGTRVVKYREAIGGEISSSRWNRQFFGKDYTSGFKIGADIDGISGATISVKSMTRGIQRLTFLLKYIKDDL